MPPNSQPYQMPYPVPPPQKSHNKVWIILGSIAGGMVILIISLVLLYMASTLHGIKQAVLAVPVPSEAQFSGVKAEGNAWGLDSAPDATATYIFPSGAPIGDEMLSLLQKHGYRECGNNDPLIVDYQDTTSVGDQPTGSQEGFISSSNSEQKGDAVQICSPTEKTFVTVTWQDDILTIMTQ